MAVFRCKMCGGDLDIREGQLTCTCEQKLLADKIAKLKAQIDLLQEKMDGRGKLFKEKQRWVRSLLRLKEMHEPEIIRDIMQEQDIYIEAWL